MRLPSIDDWGSLAGANVLVRVDFNVPMKEVDGHMTVVDDFRIRAAVPLFEDLMSRGAHVVACTHIGRPKGHDEKLSVAPIRRRLEELCPGVELLENLRYEPGEEANDEEFGRLLVKGFDYYVNEAFGVSHRAHASIVAPPKFMRSAAGPNLIREVETLLGVFDQPAGPFVAIVGGAKVADKLSVTAKLVEKADTVIVGGGMAFTFWRALGHSIGGSLVDDSKVDACRELLETGRIVLPTDALGLPSGSPFGGGGDEEASLFGSSIPDGFVGLDIGPASVEHFSDIIANAGTILWNGPMGVFEDPRLEAGTRAVAQAVAASDAFSIIGGGDSAAAVAKFGVEDQVSFVSTGGGASLELLEFGTLPGLTALVECPWNQK